MFKKLILAALLTVSLGGAFATSTKPAAAAIDSYMFFQDSSGDYIDGNSFER